MIVLFSIALISIFGFDLPGIGVFCLASVIILYLLIILMLIKVNSSTFPWFN